MEAFISIGIVILYLVFGFAISVTFRVLDTNPNKDDQPYYGFVVPVFWPLVSVIYCGAATAKVIAEANRDIAEKIRPGCTKMKKEEEK